MAVTKIWNIRGRAGSPLGYVTNPDKTQRDFSNSERQALQDVIAYAANEDKTEKFYYTTGINCSVECARDQFDTTKLRYAKAGGNVAYHAYQSFKPGEVTPDEAHAIGVQLAKELWGDRFQIVVATHTNTACVHNHIVINSVSFRDGKKFHDSKETYRLLRETSDRICLEHGLSVIENTIGRSVEQYLYNLERSGKPTRYTLARQAIDEAAACSLNIEDFKAALRERGYSYRFNPQRKYWTVTPPGGRKPIRIHQLGDNYTRESIEQRIYGNDQAVRSERRSYHYRRSNHYNLRRRIDRIMGRSGLEKLYLRYCYELGVLPKRRQDLTKLHILLKEDLLKCDLYSAQAQMLAKYHVNTDDDLALLMESIESKLTELTSERSELRLRSRRVLSDEEKEKAKAGAREMTVEIKELRRELSLCKDVQERSGHIRENLEIIDRDRKRDRDRERGQ